MNYATLLANTPTWMFARNKDLPANMERIVAQAHEKLFSIIAHEFFRTRITGLTTGTDGAIDLSTQTPKVMEVRAIRLKHRQDTEWVPIARRDLEMLGNLYARNRPGRPRFYAELDGPLQLQLYPTPNMAYEVEVTCNRECPVLSPSVETNLLGDRAPLALEAAVYRQAAIFLRDDEATAIYDGEMTKAVNEVNAAYGRRLRDDTAERPRDTTNATGS